MGNRIAAIDNDTQDPIVDGLREEAQLLYRYLQQLSEDVYSYVINNPGKVTLYVVGTALVCVVGGAAYYLYMNPAAVAAIKAAIAAGCTKISTTFMAAWKLLRNQIRLHPRMTVAMLAVAAPSAVLYQSWRREKARQINEMILNTPEEIARRINEDELLGLYTCPLALVPSMRPVRVEQGNLVWYFDQDLLLSFYDACVAQRRVPYNPLTMLPLPFASRADIVVDQEAVRIIQNRIAALQQNNAAVN
jgi:hypothetical protein